MPSEAEGGRNGGQRLLTMSEVSWVRVIESGVFVR